MANLNLQDMPLYFKRHTHNFLEDNCAIAMAWLYHDQFLLWAIENDYLLARTYQVE